MMKRLEYDFKSKPRLNFRKRRRTIPLAKVPKGKHVDYYNKTKRGLGYVTLISSEYEPEFVESFFKDHSFDNFSWDFDTSVGTLFTSRSVNMLSAGQREDEKKDAMLHSENDPWIKHLNTLWKIRFEH